MAEQQKPQLMLGLEDTKQLIHFRIQNGDRLMAAIVFSAVEMDALIEHLVEQRANMKPEIPVDLQAARPAMSIAGTHFDFAFADASRELVFSARHPGLGWLSLRFRVKLLERMLKIARSFEGGKTAIAATDAKH